MKNIKLKLMILALLSTSSNVVAKNTILNGKTSISFKTFYFNGDRDNRSDRIGLSTGGIIKYESQQFNGLKTGFAYYGSYDLLKNGLDNDLRDGEIDSKSFAGSTEMVNSDGSSISTLGEMYLQFNTKRTMFKLGRQRLNTPFVGDYYNRFLPNSYEALLIENKDIINTILIGTIITKWKYKASDKFVNIGNGLGLDENMLILGAKNKSIFNTKTQAYYYLIPNAFNTVYLEMKNSKILFFNGGKVSGAFQYLNQKDNGKVKIGTLDTYLTGIKIAVNFDRGLSFKTMYNQVGDDTIVGSGTYYSDLGLNNFINYTDIQIDGEALNAGAKSYGMVVGYNFKNGFNSAFKFVHIEQDLTKNSIHTKNTRPSSNEWNIDIKHKIDKQSKVRIRFANINYESSHKNEFDENNLRIIYDFKF
jgi:imipenem/basic amino acid-specific outer membrane pore